MDRLGRELREFAEHAFGPQGVPSLELLFFGDFGPSRHAMGVFKERPFILARSERSTRHFRVVREEDKDIRRALDEYRDAMRACPVVLATTEDSDSDSGHVSSDSEDSQSSD